MPPEASNMLRAKPARSGRKKKNGKKWRSPFSKREVAIFLLLLTVGAVGAYGFVLSADPTKIAPGVAIGALDVSGRRADEATALLREKLASLRLTFKGENESVTIEAAAPVARFRVDEAVQKAFTIGKNSNTVAAFTQRVRASFFGMTIQLPYTLDREALLDELAKKFGKPKPAQNANLIVRLNSEDGSRSVTVSKEKEGVLYDFNEAINEAEKRLGAFSAMPIAVRAVKDRPVLAVADVESLKSAVDPILDRAPLTVNADGRAWKLSRETVADWIDAQPTGAASPKAKIGVNREKAAAFLEARGTDLYIAPKDAVFILEGSKVKKFEPSIPGQKLDVDGSIALIETSLFGAETPDPEKTIELPMAEVPPTVDTASSNPYGIREIIGIGETNFVGSPKNRRHNIAVGAAAVNGSLVMAGEEFSLLKTLGEIDEKAGYLRELVIKENKTTPEFGGGLCQIGSTTFRAVLASGLPVTARQNHSYRVPYYERDGDGKTIGPGKDATIYSPNPDFKFINDTGFGVLITTAIKGDRLTFAFWGTSDGRKAEQTKAKVFNIVAPPEKKVIPTTDIPVGTTKCTEKAHVGSDAVFTYTVTYPNGEVKIKDFKSHYKPWREVCLVGVDAKDMPVDGATTALPSEDAAGAAGH